MLEKLVESKWGKRFINLAGGLFIGGSVLFNQMSASAEEAVLTVLCHGIKGSSGDMNRIEDVVKDQSYVLNVDYPSTENRIKFFSYDLDLAIRDRIKLLENKNVDVEGIVLVGHSMGGLVERYYIECGNASFEDVVSKVKAIVMIGTPNHGSPLADIVCYHAALAGERSDAIPISIIEQTKGPKSGLLKTPSLTEPLHAKGIKGFLDVLTKPTTLLNFVDSSWGRRAVYDLNTAPDGFIESELNKFGLKPGVYYCVIRGNDNNFATAILVKGPSDGVVPAGSADLSDKVSNKENYRLETVKANHLNITENKDTIRIVKENLGRIENVKVDIVKDSKYDFSTPEKTLELFSRAIKEKDYGLIERCIANDFKNGKWASADYIVMIDSYKIGAPTSSSINNNEKELVSFYMNLLAGKLNLQIIPVEVNVVVMKDNEKRVDKTTLHLFKVDKACLELVAKLENETGIRDDSGLRECHQIGDWVIYKMK